jgi:hypothetical protein
MGTGSRLLRATFGSNAEAESLADQVDAAKEALVALASHPSEAGFGVAVTRFWKAGQRGLQAGAGTGWASILIATGRKDGLRHELDGVGK